MAKYINSILITLVFCLVLSIAVSAQNMTSPITFRISFVKVLKSRQGFMVKTRLTNNSTQRIVIDKNLVGSQQSFYTDGGYFTLSNEIASGYTGNYLALRPGQVYEDTRIVELKNEFFRIDGLYQLRLHYQHFSKEDFEGSTVWRGQSESNVLTFQMRKRLVTKYNLPGTRQALNSFK